MMMPARTKTKTDTWRSALVSSFISFTMLITAGLAAALVVVPRALNGASLTVLSGSMEPGIKPGDIVVTRGVDEARIAKLKVGDVITFMPYPDDATLVTHRIVGLSVGVKGTSYVTQGDNNNMVDPWGPVQDYQIHGQLLYRVPLVGWARAWLGGNTNWVVLGLAAGLMIYGAVSVVSSFRRSKEILEDAPARRAQAD